ncbi:hypothetical protein [Phenylobacterium sp.]|uniref:hypothetical protein n=1 Tax=Phenylobacterium sp. TaxID=1871053 RepID=UPI00262DD9E9|nr:hypothetical protein [Phenylobacterium sp.]
MNNRVELRSYVRYQLTQLGAVNGAHAFEQLCFELARQRHVPNLLPATGPVQSGGDQGRDFESYRTFLASGPLARSSFAARAAQDLLVGACTLERNNLPAKIKRDLTSMFSSGEKPSQVLYFCQADLPVAQRHKLQAHCRETYDAALEIYDGQAIADQLADADTFWIASQYLSIPANMFPTEEQDEDYLKLRIRWLDGTAEPEDYADFLDVKRGVRSASHGETVRHDLERWIAVMRGFETRLPEGRLRQKARYEITVAELRGRGDLDPARSLVDAFFGVLPGLEARAVDLLDAAVLSVYCWGAILHKQTTLDMGQVATWGDQVSALVEAAEGATNRKGERCTLLEARAMLAGLTAIEEGPEAAVRNVLAAWGEVLTLVKNTQHYPIAHIADLVDQFAPLVADQPAFQSLRDQIEELIDSRTGQHAVAKRSYRRALAQFEAGNRLAAIDELQKAKLGWFSGDEMEKSVMAMLLLAECYAALHLHVAARYYAAGAAYIAVNADDEDVRALTPLAAFLLADSFFGVGEGMSFLRAFGAALQLHQLLTPHAEGPVQTEIEEGLVKSAILVHVMRRLAPDIADEVDRILDEWPMPREDFEAHVAVAGAKDSAWALDDIPDLEARVAESFGTSPFADLGETRSTRWSALGIEWEVTSSADSGARAAALSLAAILQVLQVELANAELLIIPSTATLYVTLGDVKRPQVREARGERLGWEVMMPRVTSGDDDRQTEAIMIVAQVLGGLSAMSEQQFTAAFEGAFKRGLSYRANSVRPARELMVFAQEQLGDTPSRLQKLKARTVAGDLTPIEPAELAWPTTPGPGYSKAKADEVLGNRYRLPFEMAGPSLQRMLGDARIRGLLLEVRAQGYRDWQILGALLSMVMQFQAQATLEGPHDIEGLSEAFRQRSRRGELPDDPEIDLASVTPETLRDVLFASTASVLQTWGLRINRQAVDPKGVRRLLDVRYRQADDDIPHKDILA